MSDERIEKETVYEFKIKGRLEKRWANWFENLTFSYKEDITILRGPLRDQAALHGVLNHFRNLNLKLISVQTIDEKEK